MPRTGSTLLTKILNQNPEFYASTTSPAPVLVRWMRNAVHNTNEFKALPSGDLGENFIHSVRGAVEGWHHKNSDKVVFDKNRDWLSLRNIANKAFPEGKYVFCIRDLRSIVSSHIKLSHAHPQYCHPRDVQEASVGDNIDLILNGAEASPTANVLHNIIKSGVLEEYTVKSKIHIIRYEDLTSDPKKTMRELYDFLGYDQFTHSFTDIAQGEDEHDTVWSGWGEHTIRPDVVECANDYEEVLGVKNSEHILNQYKWFYDKFYPELKR